MLKSFHERIGLKTEAYTDSGGTRCCRDFRPQIDRALAAVATNYGWAELYNNESKKATFQTAAAQEFTRLLPAAVGGDYFCGLSYNGSNDCGELSFTIQKPTPLDKGIIDGLEAKQRAELAKATQEQKNQQVNVELQSVKQQVAMLGAQGYLLKTAIESGKIQFMVIPQNGNVSIPVPTTPTTPTSARTTPLTHVCADATPPARRVMGLLLPAFPRRSSRFAPYAPQSRPGGPMTGVAVASRARAGRRAAQAGLLPTRCSTSSTPGPTGPRAAWPGPSG